MHHAQSMEDSSPNRYRYNQPRQHNLLTTGAPLAIVNTQAPCQSYQFEFTLLMFVINCLDHNLGQLTMSQPSAIHDKLQGKWLIILVSLLDLMMVIGRDKIREVLSHVVLSRVVSWPLVSWASRLAYRNSRLTLLLSDLT